MTPHMDGGCLCGAVRYRVSGPPSGLSLCHCGSCRRASGAPSLAWAIFPDEAVTFTAGAVTTYESSPGVRWGFCPRCGSTLTYTRASRPGLHDVTTATLDDPEAFAPRFEIWTERRLSWVTPHPDLPQFARTRAEAEPAAD